MASTIRPTALKIIPLDKLNDMTATMKDKSKNKRRETMDFDADELRDLPAA